MSAGERRYDRLVERGAALAASTSEMTPVRGISWDRIYPRCVWCNGENYVMAVLAYSRGERPCAAVHGCGRYLPEEYRLVDRVLGAEQDGGRDE